MNEPAGLRCPLCGADAAFIVSATQAFCGTADCPMLSWNPLTPTPPRDEWNVVSLVDDDGRA